MSKFPTIIRKTIEQQRFTTLGDWWEQDTGRFTISISEMLDWRHEFLVLIHELTEWAICQAEGVPTAECDAFDTMWEEEIHQGLQDVETEAGFDRRCPYRTGHIWGARMERLFAFLLHVRWREYCRVCDDMIRNRGVWNRGF